MNIKRTLFANVMVFVFTLVSVSAGMLTAVENTGSTTVSSTGSNDIKAAIETIADNMDGLLAKQKKTDRETYWVSSTFKSKKKSSSLKRAIKRATEEINSKISGWIAQVMKNHTVTGEKEIEVITEKWGISGFKWYVRLGMAVRIECVK